MAVNHALTEKVRKALSGVGSVEEKKMFRGIAFMVNGKMCVTVGDNRMMCRIDPSVHKNVVTKEGVSTVVMKGKNYLGWIYVDESVLSTKKSLTYWIKMALDYNAKIK